MCTVLLDILIGATNANVIIYWNEFMINFLKLTTKHFNERFLEIFGT